MEFRILGSLEVRADGGQVALGGAKPRGLLAVLLLHANRPVHPNTVHSRMDIKLAVVVPAGT
jgi:DNA-binding SARP family transcriptional activator